MRLIPIVLLLVIATPAASAQTLYGWSGGWEITQRREFCTMRHAAKGPDAVEITVTKSIMGRTSFGAASPRWTFANAEQLSVDLVESGAPIATGWAPAAVLPDSSMASA